jgi:hypothetical protein
VESEDEEMSNTTATTPCSNSQDCDCGCCSGIAVQTPQAESNLPGLSSIAYRTGTWATFKQSMLARLSSADYPALAALKTRDDDDISIAFLDATAVVLDILTFYQERLANESYLRTATQLNSLTHLSRLIGYQPSPGVGASTYLAFTLRAATGLPANPNTTAITIPAGTTVQSVPGQGQTPQSFQTTADILAKPDWNALPVQTTLPWAPYAGQTSTWLAGTATQLNPGDALLIVGDERLINPLSNLWDLVHVTSVQTDTVNQRTLVTWAEPLGSGSTSGEWPTLSKGPAQINPQVFALRQRANLFGYSALNPILLSGTDPGAAIKKAGLLSATGDWQFLTASGSPKHPSSSGIVDLDATYAKVAAGSWMVLLLEEIAVMLYNLTSVHTVARSDYALSAKVTRTTIDTLDSFNLFILEYLTAGTRSTAVLAQSELLPTIDQPLDHPLYGTLVDLDVLRPDLVGITAIAITGHNPKLTINVPEAAPFPRGVVLFTPDDDPTHPIPLAQGAVLTLLQPPNSVLTSGGATPGSIPSWSTDNTPTTLAVALPSGRTGTLVDVPLSWFTLTPPSASDPIVQEYALVTSVGLSTAAGAPSNANDPHTLITLATPLLNVYDRASATINANVGAATAGSPVNELLGSGSAATPNQQFTLKQSPLTYVAAPTPTGSVSSLSVSANGADWTLVPTLYDQPSSAQVFTTLNLPGGTTQVIFGDGVEGATLPTGTGNIQAAYRVGIGSAGNVPAASITTLVDRPVGVSGVSNPQAATGGQDAQTLEGIRANAPLSVLTLGRAVSLTDYQNFAATFAGIAQASALWVPNGPFRGVSLTVAAAGGAPLLPTSQTFTYLLAALQKFGNPNVAIYLQSFYETTFGFNVDVLYDPDYSQPAVKAAALALLQTTYSFANRTFGQGVYQDELAALLQTVPGILAVNVYNVHPVITSPAGDIGSAAYSITGYNNWKVKALARKLPRPCTTASNGICPFVPVPSLTALPKPAEILVLDPDPSNIIWGTMS